MNTTKIRKIAAGHYEGQNGSVQNCYCSSGARHTRNQRAKWLVTPANGSPSYFVPTLARAREVIA